MMGKVEPAEEEVAGANTQDAKQILMNLQAKKMQVMIITDDHGMALPVEPIGTKIESLVIECIVAIDMTWVWYPADAAFYAGGNKAVTYFD